MSREDVDDLLEQYLEGTPVEPQVVTKRECRDKHDDLTEATEKAIREAMAKTATGLKLWAVGALLAAIIAVLTGYTCSMTEVGAYKERIDVNTRQLEKLEHNLDRLLQMFIDEKSSTGGRRQP